VLTGHVYGNLVVGMSDKPTSFRAIFDPERYSNRVLALILEKAEAWHCSPLEAELRLLDELAAAQSNNTEDAA
jgi:hypothetical protein